MKINIHLHFWRYHGIKIYRVGTRLFMLRELYPARYSAQTMIRVAAINPAITRWLALM